MSRATAPTSAPARARGLAALALALAGCATAAPPPPRWVESRPAHGPKTLSFVGEASGQSDEASAREQAIQRAISELTVYCGASVKSESRSEEREEDGRYSQVYEMTVDVAGEELTLRQATVKEVVAQPAGDGSFNGYALLEWPRSELEAVLAMQRARGERALATYQQAEAAARENQLARAREKAQEALALLGPMRAQTPLAHPSITTTALLQDAARALAGSLEAREKERRTVVAVAVECSEDGKPRPCKSVRVGSVRQRAASAMKVSADAVPPDVARQILASGSPSADAAVRASGFVLAVHYEANLLAKDGDFVFVTCGARAVVYDTDANRILQVKEVKPVKGGHVSFEGAADKGCAGAEAEVLGWVDAELGRLR